MKGLMVGLTTTVCIYRILAFKELFANHRSYNRYLPETVLATLREPVTPETDGQTDEVLLPESFVDEVTEVAVSQSAGVTNQPNTTILQNRDIPLPNAADVFRDGIKARLTEAGALNRGEIWVFDLTRSSVTGDAAVAEGDRLYAVVEDIDVKTGRLYLRAEKLFSPADRATYTLALGAVDASTGRIGIKLPEVDQVKAGWILTWKVL